MAGVDGPSHGYYLAQSTNSTGVVIEMSGLSPMAVFAGSSMLFTMLAVMLHCLLECGFYDSFSELLVRLCRSIGRVPRVVRRIAAGIGVSMVFTIMILLLRGVDGRVTEDKVARTRALVVDAPMPESVRQIAIDVAMNEHDVAFMPNYLSRADAASLAGSLGIPVFINSLQIDDQTEATAAELSKAVAPRLNLLDSGAAIDTSDGVLESAGGYAVAGTRGVNLIAVSTTNGTVVPPEHITNRIPVRHRDGTIGALVRPSSLIMDNCPHNLISVGTLAATDGYGFWIGP